MRYLQGIITWIDSLESGRQFRNWAAILVKIFTVAILVGLSVAGIVVCVDTITASKDVDMISVLSGPVLLIVAYFTAEGINVFANIAESLNNIETKLVDEEPASDS